MSANWSAPQRIPSLYSTSKRHVSPCWWHGGLYPCTRPLPPSAVQVWRLAQSLICSYRRGHGNSDPKILFFFPLFFTMYLTTTLPQKKTPTGMFLRLPNVHIFHIFTFTVYDISVGMWELTYVGLTGPSLGSVPCPPGVSVSLPPSHRLVVSLLSLHGENGAKVNLLDKHMSLSHLRFCWTNQSESETVEQLKVHGESSAPFVFVGCCSICDQNINCHNWGSDMPTCWAVSISFILYVTIAVKVPLFLRWWV